jgi:hypothetical protein
MGKPLTAEPAENGTERAEKANCETVAVGASGENDVVEFSAFFRFSLRSLRLKALGLGANISHGHGECIPVRQSPTIPLRWLSSLDYPRKSQSCTDVTLAHTTAFAVYMHGALPG